MTTDTLARPMMFDLWRQNHYIYKDKYTSHQTSYIENLLPEIAVQLNVYEILDILQKRLGAETMQNSLDTHQHIQSPVSHYSDGRWLKKNEYGGYRVYMLS